MTALLPNALVSPCSVHSSNWQWTVWLIVFLDVCNDILAYILSTCIIDVRVGLDL